MKIAGKISIVLFIVAIIFGTISMSVFYLQARENLKEQIYLHLKATAEIRSAFIECALNECMKNVKMMATGNAFKDVVNPEEDYVQRTEGINKRIKSIILSHENISGVRILNKKGIVIASSHKNIGEDESNEVLFRSAKEGAHIGDVHFSRFTQKPVISIVAPIFLKDVFSGVVIVNYDAEVTLFKITSKRTGLGETGEIYLINKDGYMITPSHFIENTLLKLKVDTENTRKGFEDIKGFSSKTHEDTPMVYKDYRGNEVLGVHDYIPEMQWLLFVKIDLKEAFVPLVKIRFLFLAILIFVPIVAFFMGIGISKILSKPIRKLHKGAEAVAAGNLNYKVGISSEDEIGGLSRAFDKMTKDLRKTTVSKDYVENVIESMMDLLIVITPDGKIERVNSATVNLLDYSEEELIDNPVGIIFEEEKKFFKGTRLEKLLKEGSLTNYNIDYKAKDGRKIPMLLNGSVMRDKEGNITSIVCVARDIIERKKVDEAQHLERTRMMSILNAIPDGVYIVSRQYDIEYINPVIEQEFGPINGRKCYEYFHDRREACPWCKNTDVFAGKSVQWEWHSSKNDRYYDLFDTQFMNADGSISKFEIFRDITKRKKAEQNIRDLAHIVESSLNEIYIFDAETFKFVQVNYGACENIGYTLEELTNLTPLDIKPKFTKESFMQLVEPLKSGAKKILILETVHKRKDGSLYDVEVHLQLSDFISKPVFVAIILDITERKKAEEALRSSEVQKNAILNGITSNIALVDKDLKILWVNKVGAASVNKLPEEMIGHTCHAFWADPGKPCDKCPTLRAFQTKQSEHVIMNTPDGRVWDERGEPVFDAEGNVVAMVEIAEDITDQKRMEEELIKEKRMESVGLLAGGIAHDFNNLLTVIFGNIKMIKMFCSPDEKMGQYLKASEKSLEDAKALTNQLLTFSRGGEPVKEIASIGGILKDIVNFNLHGARIKPQFSIDEGLWNAEVDVGQIKQIISNLVINALQAMPGSGNLYVKASNSIVDEENKIGNLEEGKYIHFSIKDEGIGISKGVLSQIFNPFFSSKKEGRGLGLSVCHSIVKKHNGFITAESETDKGTTFHVYLPAIEKELSLKVNKEVKPKVELSLKILIMDDEEDITTMLGDFFKRTGCQIEIASDGKEAIEKYKKAKEIGHKFDAVLLDLTIPGGMGGQETLEELKKHDRDVKAFVMSGYSNDPVMSDYEEYGFKGIIQKPFDLEDVVDVIKKAVEGA